MQWHPIKLTADISSERRSVPDEMAKIWLVRSGIKKCVSVKGNGEGCSWKRHKTDSAGAIGMCKMSCTS